MGQEPEERNQAEQDAAEDLELRDEAADGVKGGDMARNDINVNKAKTADKAAIAMDAYIRG